MLNKGTMPLENFDDILRCELADFRQFWAARNSEDPGTWPRSMTARQWFENFATWLEVKPQV